MSETARVSAVIAKRRYGKLAAVRFSHSGRLPCGAMRHYVLCLCDCGKELLVDSSNLSSGSSLSCGCGRIRTVHGNARRKRVHPIYRAWQEMIRRCADSSREGWDNYGGRGIKVCEQWLTFENFRADMMPSWRTGLSLGRINNDESYCKENCQWETRKQQNNNTRRNRVINALGKSLTISQWSEETGLPYSLLLWRLDEGWSHEEIVSRPSRRKKVNV